MGKVIYHSSMSLDGFVAGPNDEVDEVFRWYDSGDTDVALPGTDLVFKISSASARYMQEAFQSIGAMVTGRRNFNVSHAWSGHPPLGVHHFVVTHSIPQEWTEPGSPFTFVTDGVESAVAQAKTIAGEKHVAISSASIMRQCLQAGLLEEISIDLAPVLIGEGIRLFEHLGIEPIRLEKIQVVDAPHVTHLRYRVLQ